MATPLISLEPIGMGTPLVESLDSYAHRVSAAHCVPRSHLDLLVLSGDRSLARLKRAIDNTSLNSSAERTRTFGFRLAELTGRSNVAWLSLGLFAGSLSQCGLQRQMRAWCTQCVKETREAGAEQYWPLVWSIPDYLVCHKHSTYLTSCCPTCQYASPLKRPWKGAMHNCPQCELPLDAGRGDAAGSCRRRRMIRADFASYDSVASAVIGELASNLAKIYADGLEVRNNFARLVRHVGETTGTMAKAGTLARVAGLSKATAHSLSHAKLLPSLTVLVRLSVVFDVSLSGLICPELWHTDVSQGRKIEGVPRRRPPIKRDWSHIQSLLEKAASEERPISPNAFSRSLRLCPTYLSRKLKSDKDRLSMARRLTSKEDFTIRAEGLAIKIAAAVTEFTSQGRKVSDRKLAAALGVHRSKALFKEARRLSRQ
jgi:hypothetical protein